MGQHDEMETKKDKIEWKRMEGSEQVWRPRACPLEQTGSTGGTYQKG